MRKLRTREVKDVALGTQLLTPRAGIWFTYKAYRKHQFSQAILLLEPLFEKRTSRISWRNFVRNGVASSRSSAKSSGGSASHPRPVPSFSFHFFLAPILPGVTAVSPRSVPSSWQYPAQRRRITQETHPRADRSRRRDVTPAPPPSSAERGGGITGAGWPPGGGAGAGARVQLRAFAAIATCAVPSSRPLPALPGRVGPGGLSILARRGTAASGAGPPSAAQCQAPPQLCESEAAAGALGGGRARPGPLMVPPRRHRGAGRPGRQGKAPKSPRDKMDRLPKSSPTFSLW